MSLILKHHLVLPLHFQNDVTSNMNGRGTPMKKSASLLEYEKSSNGHVSVYKARTAASVADSTPIRSPVFSFRYGEQPSIPLKFNIDQSPPKIDLKFLGRFQNRKSQVVPLPKIEGPKQKTKWLTEPKLTSNPEIDLNLYLNYVNECNLEKRNENKSLSLFLSMIDHQHQALLNENQRHDPHHMQAKVDQAKSPNKLKKDYKSLTTKKQQKAQDSQLKHHTQALQVKHQNIYETTNAVKITQLKKYIKDAIHNLLQLNTYLNNEKKMFHVVKKLVGSKKGLIKLLLNEDSEEIYPLNEQTMFRNCSYKENVVDGADVVQIDCYNFNLIKEIQFLITKTYDLNLLISIQGINALETTIMKEYTQIKQSETDILRQQDRKVASTLLSGYKNVGIHDLRFMTNSMTRYRPHEDVQLLELKYGPMDNITSKSKIISQTLSKTVMRMSKQYAKPDGQEKGTSGNQSQVEDEEEQQ